MDGPLRVDRVRISVFHINTYEKASTEKGS